jgi:hypothetical protein
MIYVDLEVEEKRLEATRLQVEKEIKDAADENPYILSFRKQYLQPDFIELIPEENAKQIRQQERAMMVDYYLGNFMFHLPNFQHPENGVQRQKAKTSGYWDKTYEEFLAQGASRQYAKDDDPPSTLRLKQTGQQFYQTIDEAIEKEGISLNEINELQQKRGIMGSNPELNQRTLPVFVRLRAIGYNNSDFMH